MHYVFVSFPNVTLIEKAFGKHVYTYTLTPLSVSDKLLNFNLFFDSLHERIANNISEFEKKNSYWTIQNIFSLYMNVYKFNPLRGSSYIDLPNDIQNQNAVVNVKNANIQCF